MLTALQCCFGSESSALVPQPARVARVFTRLSASRGAQGPVAAFAGGALPTVLGCCAGTLLPMLSTRDVLPLRATCKEAAAAVAQHPWGDSETVIWGRLRDWRACFPRARAANLAAYDGDLEESLRVFPVADADFVHLAGLRALSIAGRGELTDAAFAHLAGTRAQDAGGCSSGAPSAAAGTRLRGVRRPRAGDSGGVVVRVRVARGAKGGAS